MSEPPVTERTRRRAHLIARIAAASAEPADDPGRRLMRLWNEPEAVYAVIHRQGQPAPRDTNNAARNRIWTALYPKSRPVSIAVPGDADGPAEDECAPVLDAGAPDRGGRFGLALAATAGAATVFALWLIL